MPIYTPPPAVPIPGHCWAGHPDGAGRCTLPPNHEGPHYNPYMRPSWDRPGTEWPR